MSIMLLALTILGVDRLVRSVLSKALTGSPSNFIIRKAFAVQAALADSSAGIVA